MLAEEAAEVIQIVCKILRHGYDSYHPRDHINSNRKLLNKELTDFVAVHRMMLERGDVPEIPNWKVLHAIERKRQYTHHQG